MVVSLTHTHFGRCLKLGHCVVKDLADKETHPCLTTKGIHHTSCDIDMSSEDL